MKNINRILQMIACAMLLFLQHAQSQTAVKTVQGKVTDIFGKPLYGALVNSANGNNGTSTNAKGEYLITVDDGSDILEFKNYGFLTQKKQIGDVETIDVSLAFDIHKQDEEIQLGYTSQLRRHVTGAVASVSGEELERSPVANFTQTLPGRLPGVATLELYSELSRSTTGLVVRGFSTARNNGPLVIVDGVLVSYNSNQTLEYISPTEIESISVLKDASSQALYGLLGANGLMVIKTKRGKKGALEIRTRIDQSMQQVTTQPTFYDAATYATLRNQAAINDGKSPLYTQQDIDLYRSGTDPQLHPNNNWYDRYMKDFASMQRVSVNLTGGNDRVQYYSNLNVMHQGGYFKTDQPRYNPDANNLWVNYRTNVDMNITKYLKAYVRLSGNIKRERNAGGAGNQDIYSSIFQMPPNVYGPVTPAITDPVTGDVIDEGGQVITTEQIGSPTYGLLNRTGYVRHTVTNITSQFGVDLDMDFITKGLSFTGTFNYQTNSVGSLFTGQNFERYMRDLQEPGSLTFIKKGGEQNTPLAYGKGHQSYFHLTYNLLLNYDRYFGKHHLTGLGYMFFQNLTKADLGSPWLLPYNRVHTGGELTYGYDDRYFAKLNLGYSGSEQYSRQSRYVSTPSIGIGWTVSNESFLKNNNVVSLLKLRASYGKTANDQSGMARFSYLDDIRMVGGGPIGSLQYLVTENLIGDPRIRAEVIKKSNVGIDLGLFNSLTLSVDLFKDRIDNMMISAAGTIPAYQGVPLGNYPSVNEGVYENRGYEVALNYDKVINKNWRAYVGGNLTYAKNNQINLNEAIRTSDYAYRKWQEGFSVGQQFGYLVDYSNGNGFFNSQEELTNSSLRYTFGTPRVGDLIYRDLNGDGTLDERDMAPIGTGVIPRYFYGISGGVTFKSFELNVLFQGVAQFQSLFGGIGVYETSVDGVFGALHNQAWTAERYAAGEEIKYPALSMAQTVNHQSSDFFSYNRAFIRLKNVELAYSLPVRAAKAISAEKIRILLSGQNLITWDKMKSNDFGPEGGGYLGFPVYRVFNAGLSVTF